MLVLPIKKKWFDMIKSGEKTEEYREIKPYYDSRFGGYKMLSYLTPDRAYPILFRNGYGKNKPTIKCYIRFEIGYGKPEWGAEPNKLYYVLKIFGVEEIE